MVFRVKAEIRESEDAAFYRALTDGTVQQQKPDGAEVVSSLHSSAVENRNLTIRPRTSNWSWHISKETPWDGLWAPVWCYERRICCSARSSFLTKPCEAL